MDSRQTTMWKEVTTNGISRITLAMELKCEVLMLLYRAGPKHWVRSRATSAKLSRMIGRVEADELLAPWKRL